MTSTYFLTTTEIVVKELNVKRLAGDCIRASACRDAFRNGRKETAMHNSERIAQRLRPTAPELLAGNYCAGLRRRVTLYTRNGIQGRSRASGVRSLQSAKALGKRRLPPTKRGHADDAWMRAVRGQDIAVRNVNARKQCPTFSPSRHDEPRLVADYS